MCEPMGCEYRGVLRTINGCVPYIDPENILIKDSWRARKIFLYSWEICK